MPRALDLSPIVPGQVFGTLTVLERAGSLHRFARWLCRCTCGAVTCPKAKDLRKGHTRSCGGSGCREWRWKGGARPTRVRAGERYGTLTVIERVGDLRYTRWLCRCDCGAERITSGGPLTARSVRSCGARACWRSLVPEQKRRAAGWGAEGDEPQFPTPALASLTPRAHEAPRGPGVAAGGWTVTTPCDACLRDDCVGRCCTRCGEQRGVPYDGYGDGGTWCQACLDEVHERGQRMMALPRVGEGLLVAFVARDAAIEGGWRQHCPECDADGVHACKMSCDTRMHRAVKCAACGMCSAPLRMRGDRCRLCASEEAER